MAFALVAGIVGGSALPGFAAALFGWQVVGVPAGDLLNVRASPKASAAVLVGYPEGTPLSLTGRCTGGVRLDAISGLPPDKQRQRVRAGWCEVWLDPTGAGAWRQGWVQGRYIRPL
jgi:hypothetical protein